MLKRCLNIYRRVNKSSKNKHQEKSVKRTEKLSINLMNNFRAIKREKKSQMRTQTETFIKNMTTSFQSFEAYSQNTYICTFTYIFEHCTFQRIRVCMKFMEANGNYNQRYEYVLNISTYALINIHRCFPRE